jgi:hypothetical protein
LGISFERNGLVGDFLAWLNQNSLAVNAAAAVAVAAATIVLVVLTALYVRATQRMLLHYNESKDPYVFVDLELSDDHRVCLVVSNIGLSVARHLRFEVLQDVELTGLGRGELGFAALPVIRDGIEYLPPNRSLRFTAGHRLGPRNEDRWGLLKLTVRFSNEQGRPFEREIAIDTDLYKSVRFDSYTDSNSQVARAIESLERRIDRPTIEQQLPRALRGKQLCPSCAEEISSKAKKCPKCHEPVPLTPEPPPEIGGPDGEA